MKILMLVILFLLIGAFFIISNENIKMNSSENVSLFFNKYGQWFDQLIDNSKSLTGYVVRSEWLPNKGKISEIE
tara:strand:+ start:934 stop:1155 length:222 start_codon:yes stop_codon:yes gene_type:complete